MKSHGSGGARSRGAARASGVGARGRSGRGSLGDMLSGVAVAIGCVLFLGGFGWAALAYRPYTVPTDSMRPTVNPGDRVLAQRIDTSQVRRGDVVVFDDPLWGNLPILKRVVGVGGDKVACCDRQGRLTVDGTPVGEPYLRGGGPASAVAFDVTVPSGRLFVLGDNRVVSEDSRMRLASADHGSVPSGDVRARVDAVLWPPSRFGTVGRPASFVALPGGVSRPGPIMVILGSVAAGAVLITGGAAYGPVARRSGRQRERRGGRVRVAA